MATRRFARSAALASLAGAGLALGALALRRRRHAPAVEALVQAASEQPIAPTESAGRRTLVVILTLLAVGLMAVSAWRFVAAATNDAAVVEGGLAFLAGALALSVTPYPWSGPLALRVERPLRGTSEALTTSSPGGRGEKDQAKGGLLRAIELADSLGVGNKIETTSHVIGTARRIQWRWVGPGVALLALVTAASSSTSGALAVTLGARGQYLCWLGGIAAVACGLSGLRRLTLPIIDRREAALLAAVLLIALGLRVYGLDQLRVLVDETHFSTGALYFLDTAGPQLLRPIGEYDPFPRIATYWVAEAVTLFGHTFTALRVVPALVSTATVGAIYLLGRELFDRRVGLAAAMLLATLPPFLHFSRLAVISVIDPLFGVLTLALLARGLRTGSRTAYVLAGVMLGLTQYFHEAGRLLFPALVALWLIGLLLTRTEIRRVAGTVFGFRLHWPFAWRGLALGLLAALIVAAPLIVTQRTQPEQIRTRLDYAVLPRQFWQATLLTSDFRPLLGSVRDAALTLARIKDATNYYGGTTALILPLFVPLFLLGSASILRRRPPRGGVVLLWMALTILGNSILTVPSTSVHFLVGLPAVALLMALGLSETLARLSRRHATALLAVLVIAVGVRQTYYYFGPQLELYNSLMRATGSTDAHDVLLRAADLPPRAAVHLVGEPTSLPIDQNYAEEVMRYLNNRVTIDVVAPDAVNAVYLEQLSRRVPQAFFFKPSATRAIERIVRAFPSDSQPQHTPSPLSGETYLLYLVLPR